MKWIHDYQLFLFDFDGLLVNTEEIHYMAYKRMCASKGFQLDWSFPHYCSIAHYSSDGLHEKIYQQFPELRALEPRWEVLYQEKKQAFLDLVDEGAVHMMPGAIELLLALEEAGIKRCVVTHSHMDLVKTVKKQNLILETIPLWITRNDYQRAKPDPECYLKAIAKHATEKDRVIGFEDSPRGLTALLGTRAKPVLISTLSYPEIPQFVKRGVEYFATFDHFLREQASSS